MKLFSLVTLLLALTGPARPAAAQDATRAACTDPREIAARRGDPSRMSGGSATAGYHGIRYGGPIGTGPDGVPGWASDPVVEEVYCGSPADRAGIRKGDVLLTVNGRSARQPRVLTPTRPGMTFNLRVRRGREVREFRIRSVETPPEAR